MLIELISFTALINNGGFGEGVSGIWKGTKNNYIWFVASCVTCVTKKKYHDFRLIHPEVAKRNINFNSAIAGFQPGWLVDKVLFFLLT